MPSFLIEDQEAPSSVVVGVDEVGYGAIAGPVVAAAVFLPNRSHSYIAKIQDSKMLSAKQREALFDEMAPYIVYGIGAASVSEIESHNILVASHIAMGRALSNINIKIDTVLIDGNRPPKGLPWRTKAIVKGDNISVSIAAASVVAKVTRDRLMKRLHAQHPEYSWDKNCGYGTKAHILSIKQHGATIHHRSTFSSVKSNFTRT